MTHQPSMPESANLQELRSLISGVCDWQLSDEQSARLEQIVCTDRTCALYYARAMQLHALLPRQIGTSVGDAAAIVHVWQDRDNDFWSEITEAAEAQALEHPLRPASPIGATNDASKPRPVRNHPSLQVGSLLDSFRQISEKTRWLAVALLVGCGTLLAYGLLLLGGFDNAPKPQVAQQMHVDSAAVATISAAVNARWEGSDPLPSYNSELFLGDELRLVGGVVAIKFESGSVITVEAPTHFRIVSAKQIDLIRGRTVAKVAPGDIGFAIVAGDMRVVDLGTEFAVSVEASGRKELHVFNGRVALHQGNGDSGKPVILREGQAAHLTQDGLELNLPAQAERFVRHPIQARATRDRNGRTIELPAAIARWTLQEGHGTVVVDQMGQHGGSIVGSQGVLRMRNGLEFFGRDATHVDLGDNPALAPAKITVAMWMKLSSDVADPSLMAILSKRMNDASKDEPNRLGCWEFAIDWQARLIFRVFSGNESVFVGDALTPNTARRLQDGDWHHVAGVYDGESASLYLDGELLDRQALVGQINPLKAPLYLGQFPLDEVREGNAFKGKIGGPLVIYDRAFGKEQIEALLCEMPLD